MPFPILADDAKADFRKIVRWSHERFGEQAALRYLKLLQVAIIEIGRNPENPLSKPYFKAKRPVRLYHLRHSRKEALIDDRAVQNPRHFIVYTKDNEGVVKIG